MEDDPLFRRIRQHAELRLTFNAGQSDKQRLEQIKEFMRLEKEMLLRYHRKGERIVEPAVQRKDRITVRVSPLKPRIAEAIGRY